MLLHRKNKHMLSFTPSQLALLGFYFLDETEDNLATYTKISNAVSDIIAIGDPYDAELINSFVQSILNKDDILGKLESEKDLSYFVAKAIFWAEKAVAPVPTPTR